MDVTIADQDSDSLYVTNQPSIVEYAKHCYKHYPTIVNNIPKEKNEYSNSMDAYAQIDNSLAEAQLAIGESSNLAQICLTYTYNFDDQKYADYVCILSVLAQVAIDNAKRRFDIDLVNEIKSIKQDMNIKDNGYPSFWLIIRRGFNKRNINRSLSCPMNYLYSVDPKQYKSEYSTLPMSYYFQKYQLEDSRRKCKKVEDLIEQYSLELVNMNKGDNSESRQEKYLLLQSNFDELIRNIKTTYVSGTYVGLFSWLLDRAFVINPSIKQNVGTVSSTLNHNRSMLIRVLYEVNKTNLLKCFSKNLLK